MMTHFDLIIEQAEKMKANEVLIFSQRPILFKVGPRWKTKELDFVISPSEMRTWLLNNLSELNKGEYLNGIEVCATTQINNGLRQIKIIPTQEGSLIHVHWQLPSSQLQLEAPELAKKILLEGKGLYVVSGPVGCGRREMLSHWVREFSDNKVVFLFSDRQHEFLIDSNFLWRLPLQQINSDLIESVIPDLILIDSEESSYQRTAIELAEKGFRVLLTMSAVDGISILERFADFLDIHRSSALRRLSQVFQMLLLMKLVPANEEPYIPIYDLLLGTEEVRSMIRNNTMIELETQKRNTFNQSLVSHVLRRKIDLKVSYIESSNPKELDLMYQKIGI